MGLESQNSLHTHTALGVKIAAIITSFSVAVGALLAIKSHTEEMAEIENREGVKVLPVPAPNKTEGQIQGIIQMSPSITPDTAIGESEEKPKNHSTINYTKLPTEVSTLVQRLEGIIKKLPAEDTTSGQWNSIVEWLNAPGTSTDDINTIFSGEDIAIWHNDIDLNKAESILLLITLRISSYEFNHNRKVD